MDRLRRWPPSVPFVALRYGTPSAPSRRYVRSAMHPLAVPVYYPVHHGPSGLPGLAPTVGDSVNARGLIIRGERRIRANGSSHFCPLVRNFVPFPARSLTVVPLLLCYQDFR